MKKNKNKKFDRGIGRKIFFFAIILLVFFSCLHPAFARYQNQEKIPGAPQRTEFIPYLQDIINFGFAVIGILALFMLIIGAYQYLIAAGTGDVKGAKETIISALLGLILGLCAWIILYKINPDLVNMRGITQITGGGAGGTLGQPLGNVAAYPTTKSCTNDELMAMAKQSAYGFASACRIMAFASAETQCNPNAGKNPDSSASTMFQVTDSTAAACGMAKGVSMEQDFRLAACVINMKHKAASCAGSPDPERCTQNAYRFGEASSNDVALNDPKWLGRYNAVGSRCAELQLANISTRSNIAYFGFIRSHL